MKLGCILLVFICLGSFLNSCKGNLKNSEPKKALDIAQVSKLENEQNYFGAYSLFDSNYGSETIVVIKDGKRIITTNAIPNHEIGKFPNKNNPNTISEQNRVYEIPVEPVFTGNSRWVRETGVALNGVKFEPETNERIECSTGERYRIEARQNLINMGLDFNNAHVQPTGAYHYHGAPLGVIKKFDSGKDMVHIGFAKDGFPMYYSKSGKYKPSFQLADQERTGTECVYRHPGNRFEKDYEGTKTDGTFVQDWEFVEGLGDLDKCNGIMIDGNYVYLVTDEYPYIGRCLNGEFEERHPHGPPPNGGGGQRGGPGPHGHQHGGHR